MSRPNQLAQRIDYYLREAWPVVVVLAEIAGEVLARGGRRAARLAVAAGRAAVMAIFP